MIPNVGSLAEIQERIATISALAPSVKNTAFRTLPRLTNAHLPLVMVVPSTARDDILSSESGVTVRNFELNIFVAAVELGKLDYAGLDKALDIVSELRELFEGNRYLELSDVNDAPLWVTDCIVLGDSGYSIFPFGGVAYGGAQLTLQITNMKNTATRLP